MTHGAHAKTKQIDAWRGAFGDAYIARNPIQPKELRTLTAIWAGILRCTMCMQPTSILEVGANVGRNLRVLGDLTGAELFAIEPNATARQALMESGILPAGNVHDGSAASVDFADGSMELVFTSGVLIHIAPDSLLASCREIHRVARRHIGCIEYFSDQPEQVCYHGHADLLFKRDYGAFWLDNFPDLQVLDYGFIWKRATGYDNMNWWMFEKRG